MKKQQVQLNKLNKSFIEATHNLLRKNPDMEPIKNKINNLSGLFSPAKLPVILLTIGNLIISCGTPDKKTQLDELRMEREKLNSQITILENELKAEGDTSSEKYKFISITKLYPTNFNHYTEILGKIDVDENVTVSAEMPGIINKVHVKTGNRVEKGQVLAELDNDVILKGINELKTQLDFTSELFEKQKKLWDQKIGTELQFLSAKNQKEGLENRMLTLKEQLDMSRIKSPLAGIVDEVMAKSGQMTAPGMPAFRIVNQEGTKAKAEIAEAYSGEITEGKNVLIHLPDIKKDIPAKISFVGRSINQLNRTFTVEVDIETGTEDLKPNMLAILKIIDYSRDSVIVTPINVIQQSEEGSFVMVASEENGKLRVLKKKIKTGRVYNGKAEILEGLNAGDQLITIGFQDLNDGETVRVN